MQRLYCMSCGKKIVCNGCLKPSTCPLLEGCILTPHSYTFHLKERVEFYKNHHKFNDIFGYPHEFFPFVDIESKKIYCSCFRCAKNNRSNFEMFMIHCWENLRNQIDIINPSER